jgi:hypothetical protein
VLDQPLPSGEGPEAREGLLATDQHLLHAARMNRGLKEQRAGRRETLQEILQRACLGITRRIDQRVIRPELRFAEGRTEQHPEMSHAAQGGARELVRQPRAGAGGGLIRGGQLRAHIMEEALSHG